MTYKLLLATSNLHKVAELKALFKDQGLKVDLYSFHQFPGYKAPPEDGATFQENAQLKALHAAKELGILAVADDSGLVVPALNNEPGVISARYAGANATDKENRIKLINEMGDLKGLERSAYFECCLAVASPQEVIFTTSGRCEGMVVEKERGSQGFGYDSLFIKHEFSKTFAEITSSTKNRVSHRRKAFEKLVMYLENESRTLSN
ncbi:RdgB/HAM1 family non-canonical purine NTP pyrophosphatase [Chlamydiales bacterium]|nr:RdgB/HAM1 family non-canonical purine NTP pyrophosphatase [Chlamydiales bacterium]